MDRVPLRSRAVVSAGYDPETGTLEIEFSSGRVYRFRDVPPGVYDWLIRVPNKGIYVARSINGHYAYEDVTQAPAVGDVSIESLLKASLSSEGDDD